MSVLLSPLPRLNLGGWVSGRRELAGSMAVVQLCCHTALVLRAEDMRFGDQSQVTCLDGAALMWGCK